MSQNLGLGTRNQLHMIHNVRPRSEVLDSPKWRMLPLTLGVLAGSAALMFFVFGS